MGKLGRAACIFLPMVATIMAAILIVIGVMLGQTSTAGGLVQKQYFMRLDTRYITIPDNLDLIPGTNLDNLVANKANINTKVQGAVKDLGIKEFYTAGFWGYCSGTYDKNNNTENVVCSKPKALFSFNIVDIINSEKKSGAADLKFPDDVTKVFNTVNAVSRITWILFMIGIVATGVEFVVGWFGLLSRWGSCCTTIVANIAFIALLGGAVMNTALYAIMSSAFNKTYGNFGVKAYFNNYTYGTMWAGVAFSLAAAIFWLMSTCCCSGRRDSVMKGNGSRGFNDKSAASNYERVPGPYQTPLMGQGAGYQQSYGNSSYEPMRHQQV